MIGIVKFFSFNIIINTILDGGLSYPYPIPNQSIGGSMKKRERSFIFPILTLLLFGGLKYVLYELREMKKYMTMTHDMSSLFYKMIIIGNIILGIMFIFVLLDLYFIIKNKDMGK